MSKKEERKPDSVAPMNGDKPTGKRAAQSATSTAKKKKPESRIRDTEKFPIASAKMSAIALILPAKMSQLEWLTAGRALACARRANQILIGDLLLDADERWSDESKREELIKQLGFSKKSFRNMKSTAKQVPPKVRRPDVSYSALAAVAPLHKHPKWQKTLLFAAAPVAGSKGKEHHKISLAALRESVRQTQEKNELVIVKQAKPNKSHHVKVLHFGDTKRVRKHLSTFSDSLPPRTEIFKCKDPSVVIVWHKAFDQVLRFGTALAEHHGHLAKGNATDRQPKKTVRNTTNLSKIVPNRDKPAPKKTEHENGKSWLAPLAAP